MAYYALYPADKQDNTVRIASLTYLNIVEQTAVNVWEYLNIEKIAVNIYATEDKANCLI